MRAFLLILLVPATLDAQAPGDWPAYGRDAGGSRFSPLTEITPGNVSRLEVAWTYNTGEAGIQPEHGRPPALEATPLVVDGMMYIGTPTGLVIALDPATGEQRWRYDPGVDPDRGYGDFAARGVSYWRDTTGASTQCSRRIFFATIDARLLALDAATGRPCGQFGDSGVVDLRDGLRIPPAEFAFYEVTSPPAIVGDLLITGSAIADNSRADPASGEVRAFDAQTGELRWSFDPIPTDPEDPAFASWKDGSASRTGGANVWSIIVADPARDLIFLPTSSPAPDYFGGLRPGDNRYANSIVALRASTGEVVWHFQAVHHDLWDYDNASPPLLTTTMQDGREVPVVLQATKTGMLFVLHRETGEPVFAVEERPVPASDVEGEFASPTQPFTAVTPPLSPHRYDASDAWGTSDEDREWCRAQLSGLRNEGIFTPPSTQGTLSSPGNIGGAHWGGVAVHPERRIAVIPVNRVAAMVQLIPAEGFDVAAARREDSGRGITDYEYTRMWGTPYVMRRRLLIGPGGLPCTPPPFGSLVAVSLENGAISWDVPLGTMPSSEGAPAPSAWGSPNLGGPIITASGLVFIGATLDRAFRAFDLVSGRELWKASLPAGARATPMTYEAGGRQFVVISAGGGGPFGTGDAVIAYALPRR